MVTVGGVTRAWLGPRIRAVPRGARERTCPPAAVMGEEFAASVWAPMTNWEWEFAVTDWPLIVKTGIGNTDRKIFWVVGPKTMAFLEGARESLA